ncbi:DUF1367 family protein [Litorivivens sp.]|uniref:DUF1367 family protein n=1 Tax=Litorivivens sp. TaxID=2020868 RepID=UPI0035667C4B
MATRIPMVRHGDMLMPTNKEAVELLRGFPVNKEVAVDVVRLHNGALHRKAFAFLKLAFEYWQPVTYLTKAEQATVNKLSKFLGDSGLDGEAVDSLCSSFLQRLDQHRRGTAIEKDFASFREFVTVEAGFFKTVITPAGPRREAKSWAYVNMSEDEFQMLFTAIRRVCWELILSQTFECIEHADAAAEQMMSFD